jgi:hypothetical protein
LESGWGFDGSDLTSPAQAAEAGALLDLEMEPSLPTEFRIHGVSGGTGPDMLNHPDVLRVGGKDPTAMYRRWSPDGVGRPTVPWPVEAYSWGGLTDRPLRSASWLLLAPLMLYNVAYFMLPVGAAGKGSAESGGTHRFARLVMRLLALAATAQFVNSVVIALVSTLGWQNGINRSEHPWWWIRWYTREGTGGRVGIALAAVGLVVGALWSASRRTTKRYEAASTNAQPAGGLTWRLTKPGFWHGFRAASRQRNLHTAAALALAAMTVALLPTYHAGWRAAEVVVAAGILVLAVGLSCAPLADRDDLIGSDGKVWIDRLVAALAILGAALVAVVAVTAASSVAAGATPEHVVPPRLLGVSTAIILVQVILVLALAGAVWILRVETKNRQAGAPVPKEWAPFIGGWAAAVIPLLAVVLGGVLSATVNIAVARLFAQPSGVRLPLTSEGKIRTDVLFVPDEAFAYAVGAVVATAAMLALGGYLWLYFRRSRDVFAGTSTQQKWQDRVADWYPETAAAPQVKQVATSWAIAGLTDLAGLVVTVLTCAWAVGAGALELFALIVQPDSVTPWVRDTATTLVTVGVAIAGVGAVVGLALLRSTYSNPSNRKTVGALWDVGTFWPRAVHPLAPPCYPEQAVPEVVDRIRALTGFLRVPVPAAAPREPLSPPRNLLLTGYSQGSLIAPAVVAQLPSDPLGVTGLLTLACPFRRLYGRAFPAYFGPGDALALNQLLGGSNTLGEESRPTALGRWRNVVRHTDYIGSWILARPPTPGGSAHTGVLDVVSLDPPSLLPGPGGDLSPTHYHSDWWQDQIVLTFAREVIRTLP